MSLRQGGKGEQLLGQLALRSPGGMGREEILSILWPQAESGLASQSLNTLVYSLHRQLGDALAGRPPIVLQAGRYALNAAAGVEVDIRSFDRAVLAGNRLAAAGDLKGAAAFYRRALTLYVGDLAFGSDVPALVERERLRSQYLGILARLADLYFTSTDFEEALSCAQSLLSHDPCREDAHRIAMRCYLRLGARAQAMRQYRLCREALALEFDAVPEPATNQLYELIRLDPTRA